MDAYADRMKQNHWIIPSYVDLEGKVGEAPTGAAPMNRGCAPQASPIPIDPPPG